MSSKREYSRSSRYSYRYAKADLAGIVWEGVEVPEFNNSAAENAEPGSTIYAHISSLPLLTTFDIKKEDFEVAAFLDLSALDPADSITPSSISDLDLPILADPSLFSDLDPELLALYDLVGSASAEGKATDINNDGFAESFFTDEIEVYLGLINDSEDGDPIVGAVEIDIELKGKIDILLDAGQQSLNSILDYLRDNGQLGKIKEIEIKYQYDLDDALIAELGDVASNIADALITEYGSNLEGLIEIEDDDVNPSKWAAYAFDSLRSIAI